MHSERRPRLTPAIADVRRAVRTALGSLPVPADSEPLVLVALSGGPDSLALAAATAFEATKAGMRAGAVIVNHNLQDGSADVAAAAAQQARDLGLDPVDIRSVLVGDAGGPESAARDARYAALAAAAAALELFGSPFEIDFLLAFFDDRGLDIVIGACAHEARRKQGAKKDGQRPRQSGDSHENS